MTERRDPSKTGVVEGLSVTAPGAEEKHKRQRGQRREYHPIGVYLSVNQERALKAIAEKTGQSEYNILKYAIGYFLKTYESNPGIIQTETKQVLKQIEETKLIDNPFDF